jgi:ketopantoate reductase
LTAITEGVKISEAKKLELQKMNNLSLYSLAITKEMLQAFFSPRLFIQDIIIKFIGRKYKKLRSSSLQSIESGRKSEIDFLNGYIVEQGEKHRIDTPLNKYILESVHEIEEGKKNPSLRGLEELEQKTKEIWELK